MSTELQSSFSFGFRVREKEYKDDRVFVKRLRIDETKGVDENLFPFLLRLLLFYK